MIRLRIEFEDMLVGCAVADDEDRFALQYDPQWLLAEERFPVSQHLPLRAEEWPAAEAHNYFANLLPEGVVRDEICARLAISPDNDVRLLAALGGDTAGALRFTREDEIPPERERLLIDPGDLDRWTEGQPAFMDDPARPIRLSLAGAQHKTSVVVTEAGLALPASDEPSTHILKFDSVRFAHLAANEAIMLRFAEELGVNTVNAELRRDAAHPYLMVERYDRVLVGDRVRRLHQEDFCQVFGLSPKRKYEAEGGPGLKEIAGLLREVSIQPAADRLQLIRWVIFNAIGGNADAHGKNLSLVRGAGGVRLAPAYDLVCTRAYRHISTKLAMQIGGQIDPDRVKRANWERFAKDIDVRPKIVFRELERMLHDANAALEHALETVDEMLAAQHLKRAVHKRIRGIGGNL